MIYESENLKNKRAIYEKRDKWLIRLAFLFWAVLLFIYINIVIPYVKSTIGFLGCIFRKNCASVPEERSAIPLQTEQSSAGLLVAIIYSTIPARKFKTICLGCHSA